jgi:hypothetical protein
MNLPNSEHLFLLVGSNPLPNAVAGKLLAAPRGTITLLHSGSSFHVAQRLQRWLCQQGFANPRLKEVKEFDPFSITQNVEAELQTIKASSVGLNYTGGTKAMSVYAYRATEQWTKKTKAQAVFSYLDARTLALVIEHKVFGREDQIRKEPVGRVVTISLKELLEMHGWRLQQPPTTKPILPLSAKTLAVANADAEAANAWMTWKRTVLNLLCRREGNPNKWNSPSALRACRLSLPTATQLTDVAESLRSELKQGTGDLGVGDATIACAYREPEDFCKWLDGLWLESALLSALQDCAGKNGLHDVSMNLEPVSGEDKVTGFEFDVAAMRGYQLFAFSCSTDTENVQGGKDRLKKKLFEAAIRARQLGGDEACVALVCCSDDPDKLQRETRHIFDGNSDQAVRKGHERVKVFGQRHLGDLATRLSQWIQSQSGEE